MLPYVLLLRQRWRWFTWLSRFLTTSFAYDWCATQSLSRVTSKLWMLTKPTPPIKRRIWTLKTFRKRNPLPRQSRIGKVRTWTMWWFLFSRCFLSPWSSIQRLPRCWCNQVILPEIAKQTRWSSSGKCDQISLERHDASYHWLTWWPSDFQRILLGYHPGSSWPPHRSFRAYRVQYRSQRWFTQVKRWITVEKLEISTWTVPFNP